MIFKVYFSNIICDMIVNKELNISRFICSGLQKNVNASMTVAGVLEVGMDQWTWSQ